MPNNPLVSVITPCSRPWELPRLQEIFYSQDYPNKELIIIEGPGTIGEKRNAGCTQAQGDIIIHFDSDDWYAPDYISRGVALLPQNDIIGLKTAYFHNAEANKAWLYEYRGHQPYVIESGMCYWRRVWEARKFKDINSGEGLGFISGRKVGYTDAGFVAAIHRNNTASHNVLSHMKPVSVERLPEEYRNAVAELWPASVP